jgi:tetratricopeptide (TPR) repeat protein
MARLHDHPAVNDLSFQLESFGLSAVLHLRRSDYEQALAAADTARDLARASRPSNWGSLPGYAGPAEVYLSLLESAYQRSDLDRLAHDACKLLGAYASIFPIGRPRRALATGLYHWHKGQHSRAEKDWRESLTAAESLAMRFDEALAHYELGRHLPEQDSQRVEHLEQAVSLFKSCGTPHHIDLAEQALAGGIRT